MPKRDCIYLEVGVTSPVNKDELMKAIRAELDKEIPHEEKLKPDSGIHVTLNRQSITKDHE